MPENQNMEFAPRVTVLGGGTGSFTLLSELKHFTPNIAAVVNMSDDGGSSGRLRDELGVLPPGDIRQCLVALSDAPELRDIFGYRFDEAANDFRDHSLGNIIISGLVRKYGDFAKAIKVVSSVLRITGEVIPVTTDEHVLVMQDGDQEIRGEHAISHHTIQSENPRLTSEPRPRITEHARQAIADSDIVMIAPGNTFGSILPLFTVEGVAKALDETGAQVFMASNLVTKPGQTDGWHVADYVEEVENYIGGGVIDYVIYNDSVPDKALLQRYAHDGEYLVDTRPGAFARLTAKAIGTTLIAGEIAANDRAKGILPTFIRHDAEALWQTCFRVVRGPQQRM